MGHSKNKSSKPRFYDYFSLPVVGCNCQKSTQSIISSLTVDSQGTIFGENSEYNPLALFVHKIRYEAKDEKTCMHSITLQPLVADHAIAPHMKDMYWAVQKNLVKGCRQTLDCYCVSCELLSASIADAL